MAWQLLFDASALAKRYVPEAGSQLVDHIFDTVSHDRMVCLMLGAGEAASVIVRRRNAGQISAEAFSHSMSKLTREVLQSRAFTKLPILNPMAESAIAFLEKHSINITDAVLLRLALDLHGGMKVTGDDLLLIASDERLLKAARAEGLPVFDPATQPQAELETLLGSP